jgi:hypothetical protein
MNEYANLECMDMNQVHKELREAPGEFPASFVRRSAMVEQYHREAIKDLDRFKKDTQTRIRAELEAAKAHEMKKFRDSLPQDVKRAEQQLMFAKQQAQTQKAIWDQERARLEELNIECHQELEYLRGEMGAQWEQLHKKKALLNAHANGVDQWQQATQDGSFADLSAAVHHAPQPTPPPNDRPTVTWGNPERSESTVEAPGPNQPPSYSTAPTVLKPVLKPDPKMSKAAKAARATRASTTPSPKPDTSEDDLPAGLTEHQRESYKRKMNDVKRYTPRQSSNLRNVERMSSGPDGPVLGSPAAGLREAGFPSPRRDGARAEGWAQGLDAASIAAAHARSHGPFEPAETSDALARLIAEGVRSMPPIPLQEITDEVDEEELEYWGPAGYPMPPPSENLQRALALAQQWEEESAARVPHREELEWARRAREGGAAAESVEHASE